LHYFRHDLVSMNNHFPATSQMVAVVWHENCRRHFFQHCPHIDAFPVSLNDTR
jgi:hypothetical protein